MSDERRGAVGYIQYEPCSTKEVSLQGCQCKVVGTYVDCSVADPNAHRNNLDGQDSKVIQNRVAMQNVLDIAIEKDV